MNPSVSDYELIYYVRQNDEESQALLILRYHRTIWAIIHALVPSPRPAYIDLDDLYQEGMIGLLEAVNNYKENREASFGTFARVCVEREIRSLLRKYRSGSYSLLSMAMSLDMSVSEDDNVVLMDTVACTKSEFDPVYATYVSWAHDQIPLIKKTLNDSEWKVYQMHSLGYSYKEISKKVSCSEKDVDNILQKIKKKLPTLFDT
ncbi:MAG: RNA polymerase sporulation-specific sigma factor [Erysipelotrichaceae bacterium]|nr:MAG: RNA polymerase sporulation-specific sigma [Erysipelotrichaceae bacterium]TXT19318.1 MAG: RNA polymerase sporulation-specific sigma factor [Erysipelotrichaceae bacterium]